MRRVLISIGCDKYEHLDHLKGAENDASRLVAALGPKNLTGYDYDEVLVLLSPTLAELQKGISSLDLHAHDIETLTFFFAGHGGVGSGVFWMCLKDSNSQKLSTSAYSLSSLLLWIQEIGPQHANIVIDACESGGVLGDIRSALRSNDFGDAGTSGISLLAACAKNQYAGEIDGAGLCTSVILDCVLGTRSIQEISPVLDLSEIAKAVVGSELPDQNPVFWGLNLSSTAFFCVNPHFSEDGTLRKLITEQPTSSYSSKAKSKLWKIYLDLDEKWEIHDFQCSLSEIVNRPDLSVVSRLGLLRQISASFTLRAKECGDLFHHIEIQAACVCCLISSCNEEEISEYVTEEIRSISLKVETAVDLIVSGIEEDKYFLLGRTTHSELFFLPMRISKILGWVGFAFLASQNANKRFVSQAKKMFGLLLKHYALSCSSVSDMQAAFYVPMIAGFTKAKLTEEAETYASLMFSSVCSLNGNIAASSLKPKEIISYLHMRAKNDFEHTEGIVARPSELVMALIISSGMVGLEDVFDECLIDLDRVSINAFIPKEYSHFGEIRIEDGDNFTFKIGFDIWRMSEIIRYFSKMDMKISPKESGYLLAVMCSLLLPNRVCWFLFDRRKRKQGSESTF